MQTDDKNRKINWGMLIPIIFWIVCIFLSTAKLFQTGNPAKGASASAMVYSISETAKLNNLRPYYYFKYILT